MKLITIDPETKLPKPTAEWLLIPVARTQWTRKIPIDGDRDGSKKTRNLQEIGYIYFNGVYDSRFRFLDETAKNLRIRTILKIPEDWQPDDVVKECLAIFKETQESNALDLVLSLEGLASSLSSWIKLKQAAIGLGTMSPKDVGEVISIVESAPGTIEKIKKARAALYTDQEARVGRKERILNKFEMPNNTLVTGDDGDL